MTKEGTHPCIRAVGKMGKKGLLTLRGGCHTRVKGAGREAFLSFNTRRTRKGKKTQPQPKKKGEGRKLRDTEGKKEKKSDRHTGAMTVARMKRNVKQQLSYIIKERR